MWWVRRGAQLVTLVVMVVAGAPGLAAASGCAVPSPDLATVSVRPGVQQIPNLLREIVEKALEAVRELEDSLRDQLCSQCPLSAGTVVLASLWALGHDLRRR